MLDVKFIRENTEKCKTRLAMRGKSYDEEIDTALALDQKRRDIIGKVEAMKAEQNKVSKSIPQLKKAGQDVSAVLAQMKEHPRRGPLPCSPPRMYRHTRRRRLQTTPAIRNCAAGASRVRSISSRRHIGTSARIWAFWIRTPRQR